MRVSEKVLSYVNQHFGKSSLPVYVYDTEKIREYCRRFISIPYSPKFIHFATMANSNPEFLKIIRQEGLGVFVNSPEHLKLAREIGFKGEEIIFTASALCRETMQLAHDAGIIVFLDSPNQLKQWHILFPDRPVGIRCNLGRMVKPIETVASYFIGEESRLGFTPNEICRLEGDPDVSGLHLYVGTDILNYDYFFACYQSLLSFSKLFPNLSMIDLGGGFGINYNGSFPFNIEKYGEKLRQMIQEVSEHLDKKLRLLLEPGRIIGAEAGFFACQVTDVKIRKDKQLIGINASTTQFPRPLFYPEKAIHPLAIIRNGGLANGSTIMSNVYGCSTYSRDYFLKNVSLPEASIGDWAIFGNAGSYCASAYTHFLGFLPAEEIFI
jgi:diaminopimelate decarboxylase